MKRLLQRDHPLYHSDHCYFQQPAFISFDHDLGDGANGANFATWLINYMIDEGLKFPKNFDYFVHSQNPIGAANIRGKMDAAIKHIGYES